MRIIRRYRLFIPVFRTPWVSRTCSKWDSVVKNTKKKRLLDILGHFEGLFLTFSKTVWKGSLCYYHRNSFRHWMFEQNLKSCPQALLELRHFFFFFFLVLRIFETLRSRSKGITWKIFFIKAWDLSWRKLTDFLRCGLKQNDLKITGAFLACSIINAAYRIEFLSTFKCFVPHNVWKPCLDDLSFQETCF